MTSELKTGTTTLGLVHKEGVVMATEHRATMGTLIAHKATQKLFKIDENLGLTTAGLVGDAQLLARYLKAEVELYKLKRSETMTVRAAATLMANILAGRRFYPYWVQLLIGGIDDEGGHVYSLDPAGGCIPDDYVTTGSGSPYVYGVLENNYRPNMSTNDAVDLAIQSLTAAMNRDAASGNGYDIAVISKKGWGGISDTEVNKRKTKLKIK